MCGSMMSSALIECFYSLSVHEKMISLGFAFYALILWWLIFESLFVLYVNLFRYDKSKPFFRPLYYFFNIDFNEEAGNVFEKVMGFSTKTFVFILLIAGSYRAGELIGVSLFFIAVYIPYRIFRHRI